MLFLKCWWNWHLLWEIGKLGTCHGICKERLENNAATLTWLPDFHMSILFLKLFSVTAQIIILLLNIIYLANAQFVTAHKKNLPTITVNTKSIVINVDIQFLIFKNMNALIETL